MGKWQMIIYGISGMIILILSVIALCAFCRALVEPVTIQIHDEKTDTLTQRVLILEEEVKVLAARMDSIAKVKHSTRQIPNNRHYTIDLNMTSSVDSCTGSTRPIHDD